MFCDRAKARTAVGDWEIVVHCFRHMNRDDRVAELCRRLRDLETSVAESPPRCMKKYPILWALKTSTSLAYCARLSSTLFSHRCARAGQARPGLCLSRAMVAADSSLGVDQIFGQRADNPMRPAYTTQSSLYTGARSQ